MTDDRGEHIADMLRTLDAEAGAMMWRVRGDGDCEESEVRDGENS